tara:strand:- start:580 stop:765 length:186 start_codon:yes stop_codon:yes gene_type:complete
MKFILILAVLAAVAFFVSKKLKSSKKETPKSTVKKKPASGPSADNLTQDNDYYRKPRKAEK